MELKKRCYLTCSKMFPKRYKNYVDKLISYGGGKETCENWLGSAAIFGLAVFASILLIPWSLRGLPKKFVPAAGEFLSPSKPNYILYILIGIGIFILIQLIVYLTIYFRAEERTKRIENALPDTLQLIASNLRAGMTPFKALKLSARKEFGPLKEEIDRATSEALGTESFSKTLLRISSRVKSEMLDRALKLFTTAMKSGGHLAQLLEELGRDISETRSLKRELVTNTKTYTMFIMFTVIIGTPLLLAIAIHFVRIITEIQTRNITNIGFGLSFLAGEITITTGFLTKVAIIMLIITALLASMLIGVIREGKSKYGFKYAPLTIIGSFVVFFVVRGLISGFG